jgi:hypothetical protein
VNCGPGHIQSTYSSAYLGLNIHLKVAPRQFEVSERFNGRYTANLLPNTAHILQLSLCELWSRSYTMHLQLRIFRLQYSAVGICAAIVHITSIQCALYCKLWAKYSAYPPVYAMWTVVPDIYNAATSPHIQASIFSWTYQRPYWRHLDNSMCVILQSWSQIQSTSSGFYYVDCGPGHIQCSYSSEYSGFNNQLNVYALLLEISRQLHACHTSNLVTNTAHTLQFTLCELWSRTYTTYFQLLIFRPQYSTERICAAIGDIPILRSALYCKFGVKYSSHRPVYGVWSVVPAIYKVFTAPYIEASIFNWMHLRRYWRCLDNLMLVILHSWCQIQRTSSSLRYVNCGPGHMQCNYSSEYSGFNIQLNVSALLLEISRQLHACYTGNLVLNIANFFQFTLCELWSRAYTV